MQLEDIILFIGKDGIATCDHQSDESAAAAGGGAPNHKVRAVREFYSFFRCCEHSIGL